MSSDSVDTTIVPGHGDAMTTTAGDYPSLICQGVAMSDFRRAFRVPLTKHPLGPTLWLEGREAPFRDVHLVYDAGGHPHSKKQPPYLHLNIVADNEKESRLLFFTAPTEARMIARALENWAQEVRAKTRPGWLRRLASRLKKQ